MRSMCEAGLLTQKFQNQEGKGSPWPGWWWQLGFMGPWAKELGGIWEVPLTLADLSPLHTRSGSLPGSGLIFASDQACGPCAALSWRIRTLSFVSFLTCSVQKYLCIVWVVDVEKCLEGSYPAGEGTRVLFDSLIKLLHFIILKKLQ